MKVRTGPPVDDESYVAAGIAWAGVLPLASSWYPLVPCPQLPPGTPVPPHIAHRPPLQAPLA